MTSLTEGEHFGVSLIHENDFYSKGTPRDPIYYEDRRKKIPKSPPYNLTLKHPMPKKSEAKINDLWMRYEELVKKPSENPNIKITTSKEIIEKLRKAK